MDDKINEVPADLHSHQAGVARPHLGSRRALVGGPADRRPRNRAGSRGPRR
ncbi:hypothetical protein [Umezawaea beigongshangensis]|uniref:hypothetical protein n=1 Tax=Umezawaea beigongshangensis TaxID=2780383 RepID=UPI0018F1A379|nr:hypothetical protein [Umezawaea beigongshangensis]